LVGEKVVQELGGLGEILAADESELTGIDGVGAARAADIREGLDRLREVDALERYPQM
jgi:diadenylate cyclase